MISEGLLVEFIHCLASFNYEKAKLLIESCYPTGKNESKSYLYKFCDCLMLLLGLEKKYYGLSFLGNRRKTFFSRKEKYTEGYPELFDRASLLVCERITETLGKESLILIASFRSKMADMYVTISQMGRNDIQSIGDVVSLVRPLKDALSDVARVNTGSVVAVIAPLLSVIELEVDILLQLGEAQHLMSNLYFLVPINLLYSVDEKYHQFQQLTSSLTTSSSIFSRSNMSFTLLSWFSKFYVASLAKYTLYFHSVLMRQKHLLLFSNDSPTENFSLDLVNRIATFVKRTSACNLLLIFDAAKQNVPFLGHGYVFPFSRGEKVTGMQSFPVIFSWPLDTEVSKQLKYDLVSLVLRVKHVSDNIDILEHEVVPNNSKTYFLARMEDRMYLALVFDGRRDREKIIVNFVDEMRDALTGKVIIDELVSIST